MVNRNKQDEHKATPAEQPGSSKQDVDTTDIKNAHAAGDGALERSDEDFGKEEQEEEEPY